MKNKEKLLRSIPWLVIFINLSFIFLMLFFSYLIDILEIDVLGVRTWIINNFDNPYFWMIVFFEASITEHLQWSFLILTLVIIILFILSNHRVLTKKNALPWFVLFIGVYWMFLEDRFNIRHMITHYLSSRVFGIDSSSALRFTSWKVSSVELFLYIVMSGVMIFAFVLISKNHKRNQHGQKFLIMGYIFYGMAAFSSASRHIGNWYSIVGSRTLNFIISGRELRWSGTTLCAHSWRTLGYWFMDLVIEESIELMAATFLFVAVLVYLPLAKFYEEKP